MTAFTVLRSGKDIRYGFDISRKHRRLAFIFSLLVRLIWFCETAKLSTSLLSNYTSKNTFSSNLDLPKSKLFHSTPTMLGVSGSQGIFVFSSLYTYCHSCWKIWMPCVITICYITVIGDIVIFFCNFTRIVNYDHWKSSIFN